MGHLLTYLLTLGYGRCITSAECSVVNTDVFMAGVDGYSCASTLGLKYSDCAPRPRSCRDLQKTEGGGDSWLPADVDCLPGCYCTGDRLFNDHAQCGPVEQCPCYHPYTGHAVRPGNKADLLCGEW